MDATTIRPTIRPTSGRTILTALALALLAALVVAQAAGAVGASRATMNNRIGQQQQDCGSLGGTFEYTYNYDKNGNVTTVVTTCSLGDDVLISCDVSTRSSECVPPPLVTAPSSPHDQTVTSGNGTASTDGTGTTGGATTHAGTAAAPRGGTVLAVDDDDEQP